MLDYIQEACRLACEGKVCLRCGTDLSPIETVDNSGRPTFWAGCLECRRFSSGTTKDVFNIAKEISVDYRYISMDDLCGIVSRTIEKKEAKIEKDQD